MFKFQSLSRKDVWYEIDVKSSDWSSAARFADYWFEWTDYGHSGVKHSHSVLVSIDNGADAMASAAKFLIDNPNTLENECIGLFFPVEPSRERIEFLAGLKFKDGVRRYYSADLMKVSSNYDKHFDKRWKELASDANGGLMFVVNALVTEFNNTPIQRIGMMLFAAAVTDQSPFAPFNKMEWTMWSKFRESFNALNAVILSIRAREHALNAIQCLEHNLRIARENEKITAESAA